MAIKKVIHFSDLHSGHREIKRGDFEELFQYITLHASHETLLVFTGDLFHKRVPVDSDPNKWVLELFNLINLLGMDAIFLNGTRSHEHDYMNAFIDISADSDTALAEIFPNIHFVHTRMEVKVQDLTILCYPEEYIDDQESYYPEITNGVDRKYDLLLFHGTISDVAVYNNHIETVPFKKAPSFKKSELWRLSNVVACGHIHENQEYREGDQYLSYVGSWGKMEHSTREENRIGLLHVYTLGKNDSGETIVTNVEREINHATSMFITMNAVYLGDNLLLVTNEKEEVKIDLNNVEDVEKLTSMMLFHVGHDAKVRLKLDNEVDHVVAPILKRITADNPMLKLDLKRDPVQQVEEQKQEVMMEIINEFKSLSSMEEQIQLFIRERHGTELELDTIRKYVSGGMQL